MSLRLLPLWIALLAAPWLLSDYWFNAILIPWLALALAGLGLNILTGFAGQLSLGSAAFMAVGAFAAYNFQLRIPGLPLLASFVLGGLTASLVGIAFGLPSLRIKGFYLIVSTLAAQFFVGWALTKFAWFSNDNPSGVISAPRLLILGHDFSTPAGRYALTLGVVAILTLGARNLIRSPTGRRFMAVRDMETAARVTGVPVFRTKLLAFAVSSFYCGVAGVLWAFCYLGTVEPHGLDLTRSFQVLFIIIIGGLGSVAGSFLGAAFIVLLPVLLDHVARSVLSGSVGAGNLENVQKLLFGALILFFLIKEPEGLARLLEVATQVISERLRRRTSTLSAVLTPNTEARRNFSANGGNRELEMDFSRDTQPGRARSVQTNRSHAERGDGRAHPAACGPGQRRRGACPERTERPK